MSENRGKGKLLMVIRETFPKCMFCKRLFEGEKGREGWYCNAFPDGDGIPDDVIFGDYDAECNNGIRFTE